VRAAACLMCQAPHIPRADLVLLCRECMWLYGASMRFPSMIRKCLQPVGQLVEGGL